MPRNRGDVARGLRHAFVTWPWRQRGGSDSPHGEMPLSGKERSYLRGLGHGLDAVVHVGKEGATAPVIAQITRALAAHELIKVKALRECPVPVDELGPTLAHGAQGELVQTIGRVLLLFRRRKKTTKIRLPTDAPPKLDAIGKKRAQAKAKLAAKRAQKQARRDQRKAPAP